MTMLEDMARALKERRRIGPYEDIDLARAALMAIREPDMDVGLIGAEEVNKQMRGPVKADYCAAQNSFTAMIQAILEGKA